MQNSAERDDRRKRRKIAESAEREFWSIDRLDSTLGRVGSVRIAQNSTGPVEPARRRLDISNRFAPAPAASGRAAPRIYQYGINCRFNAFTGRILPFS